MYDRRAKVLLCPLCPHLVGGRGDHSCIEVRKNPLCQGISMPAMPPPFLRKLVSYTRRAGRPCKASHDTREPRELRPQRSKQSSSDHGLKSYSVHTRELASPDGRGENPAGILGEKKPPAMHKAQRAENYLTRTNLVRLS